MTRLVAGVRDYLRQISGEARYTAYVDRCRAEGGEPLSRGEFERRRSDHRDSHPEGRCC